MNIPTISGIIRRRILLNYRTHPEIAQQIIPKNFHPKLVNGFAIVGICLIRLEEIRPKGFPKIIGISSENSAHRIAVEWDDQDIKREGVYVPRRDTNSRLNALAGGRIFPGVHHLSQFDITDSGGRINIVISNKDVATPLVKLEASETGTFPETSVFSSLAASSKFFEAGCVGYSSRPNSCLLDGLLLKTNQWKVQPLNVHQIQSSFYDDLNLFPSEHIQFDHALLMRDIPHEWHSEPQMVAEK